MSNKNPTHKFKPGQCGNKNGRPKKGETFTDIINTTIDKDAIIRKLEQLALKGDMTAIKYICDRVEGSPTQAIKHGGMEDAPPVQINILPVRTTKE